KRGRSQLDTNLGDTGAHLDFMEHVGYGACSYVDLLEYVDFLDILEYVDIIGFLNEFRSRNLDLPKYELGGTFGLFVGDIFLEYLDIVERVDIDGPTGNTLGLHFAPPWCEFE
ncbi:unnamed protein product, partial [Symbiodinium sp. CCMP2592]